MNRLRQKGGVALNACDIDIIKMCLGGNTDAFEELITRYKKLIFNTAYRMMGNREEAEDITQEVFIKIYNSLSKYDPEFKFSTWALRITSNLCVDWLRKRKGETVPIEEVYDLKDNGLTPEDEYISKERQKRVQAAINKLPDKYKELIILFHHRNLSYQEIMGITGETLTIVKNRLYRARQMLKDELSNIDKEGEARWNVGKSVI